MCGSARTQRLRGPRRMVTDEKVDYAGNGGAAAEGAAVNEGDREEGREMDEGDDGSEERG
jgi:hypothetical protein